MNGSGGGARLSEETAAGFGTLFASLSLVGLIGNVLVLVAILGDRRLRTPMNLLLVNLALADLGNLLFSAPDWLQILFLLRPGWIYPDILCPITRGLSVSFLYASILTQMAIGVERFVAIVLPMRARRLATRGRTLLVAACVWLSAVASATPKFVGDRVIAPPSLNASLCVPVLPSSIRLVLKCAECLLFYFVPVLVLVFMYGKISCLLWSNASHLQEGQKSTLRGKGPKEMNGKRESLRSRRDVVKMLIGCLAVYFLSYSPIQAIFISKVFFGMRVQLNLEMVLCFNALAIACSAANPILYTVFSEKFRLKFMSLLRCEASHDGPQYTTTYISNSLITSPSHLSALNNNGSSALPLHRASVLCREERDFLLLSNKPHSSSDTSLARKHDEAISNSSLVN